MNRELRPCQKGSLAARASTSIELGSHGRGTNELMTGKRDSIRETCERLRKLLASVQPEGILAILQEVGTVECDAVIANGDELQAVEEKLDGLLRRLIEQGIIDVERWTKSFGEPER